VKKVTKRAIYIGRWSPFHKGHLAIMQDKIDKGVPLLIMVRNTHYDLYPPLLRKRMIEVAMARLKVDAKVIIIDDMESINYGRGVGYEVNEIEVPEHIKGISATQIREMIGKGDCSWKDHMPKGADKVLEDYMKQKGMVVWFTGLPKSGKSEIASLTTEELEKHGIRSEMLTGSGLRQTISKELTFSKEDRTKNFERAVFISKLLSRNGAVVLSSFITPYQSQRDQIRKEVEENAAFVQVYVKADIETCKRRDDTGIYKEAEQGQIKDFTGVSQAYEEPENADIVLDTEKKSPTQCAGELAQYILKVM